MEHGGDGMVHTERGRPPTVGWMLRATRSEHQLPQVDVKQDDRINLLLDEMRPKTSILPKKAHTTNIVDISQLTGRNAIYGSWQERRPMIYGSQQVTLPKYDQLYCNTNSGGNRMGTRNENLSMSSTIGRREPPDYSKLVGGRPSASWQATCSEMRPPQQFQAGWLKNSRPLARGTLSPAGYFQDLESKNGPNSPIVGGFPAVVPVKFLVMDGGRRGVGETRESSSDSTLDSAVENEKNYSEQTLTRTTPRQASFMAAMARNPLRESTSYDSNNGQINDNDNDNEAGISSSICDQRDTSSDIKHIMTTTTTPLRRPRGREASGRRQNASKSMGKLDFDTLRNRHREGENPIGEVEEEEAVKMRVWSEKSTIGSSSSDQQSAKGLDSSESVDSNHNNEAMKMIRRARPKSYVLATSASMQDDVMLSLANEASSSISHDDTTSGRELPSSLMGSSSSIDHHQHQKSLKNQQQKDLKDQLKNRNNTSQTTGQTSRSLNAPHPPAAHRLQRFIALFNTNKSSDGHEPKKSRMKRSRTSLPSSRFSLPGTILQREQIERQTWIKHQENALGKSGKRNHWEDRWAILNRYNLYLCIDAPSFNTDKAVELGSHTRVDVRNSIVDIAYDWLSSSFTKQRHVVRIVTQNRSEHLIELNTESEMLSWISVLQSSSEDVPLNEEVATKENNNHVNNASPNNLHNSHSIASLASSSCSTTTSELVTSTTNTPTINENNQLVARNQLPTSKSFGGLSTAAVVTSTTPTVDSAKNRLIMHRYIAKNSQLQSPTSSKKMEMIGGSGSISSNSANASCASQAGTSKDGLENGGGGSVESTTPKSGRKWKKSKAGKQGSGGNSGTSGGSGGGSGGSQQQGSLGGPLPVLGIKLADCPIGTLGEHVPMLVQICVSVVQTHGMDTVGIYRIPGNTAAVNALKDSLSNRGFETINPHNVEALDPRWRDVNVVSSLLKMFLRKLPEPLLTDKLYPFFIDANRIATHHNRLHKLRNLLRKLPRPHYDTLRFLIMHLFEITKHGDVNKMECRNLALMFGPSIVRPSDDNMATMVTHMSDQCKIIETLIHYHEWMFDENSTVESTVPEQHPGDGQNPLEPGSYGVGVPTGVSAASFNDMHNLIRKANEDQAAAMMNEGKGQKIKNMLRRNSRRDKSKSKLKIESTAPAAMNPRGAGAYVQPTPSNTSAASVESAFCGNYQERDIDAEIESRQTISPQMTSGSVDGVETSGLDQSPSLESSLGSLPDTSRTEPIGIGYSMDDEEAKEAARRKRQEDMYSARRMFIAGNAAGAPQVGSDAEKKAIDALANHSQHLHIANSPAFEVLSEETREKIRRMQKKQSWHDTKEIRADLLKTYSPTKDLTDALSCTSDYSTTSSAPLSANPPLAVACADQPNSSSDYASSDPSPCARNLSTSPASRPSNLGLSPSQMTSASPDCQPVVMSRSQKIRMRTKAGVRDPARRHTLSDMDALKQGRLDKLARWFGLRKSSPDVSRDESELIIEKKPPAIVRTSPNELTPVSGDELL